ncbi:hypothetical protein B9H02_05770 [Prosthecochloris sp. HL-130-GSB]|nr:hypothetical protein B9H02_05770 [Prosthecochloris sp. HL-130-GSB]
MKNPSITFISAGAGSGKTTRLTELLYEKLISGRVRPEGIIATTFTTKAAAELRERVRTLLLNRNEQRLATLVAEAQIGTVNSICGTMLRRFAFELGMSIEQNVMDEQVSMLQLSKAVDEAVGPGDIDLLSRLSYRLGYIDSQTRELKWKDHVKSVVDLSRSNNISPEKFDRFARQNADDLLSLFPDPLEQEPDKELFDAIAELVAHVTSVLEGPGRTVKKTVSYLEHLRRFEQALRHDTYSWSDWIALSLDEPQKKPLQEHTSRVRELCIAVARHPRLHDDIRQYLERVFDVARRTLVIYQQQKLQAGLVDFTDQEARFLEGLQRPEIRKAIGEKLDLLMVDEFQDTSPIQLALFLQLASLAKETCWVGDSKQAIYGFRGGDTQLMQAVLDFLPDGSKEVLDSSWRSVPSLVGLSNALFIPAFSQHLCASEVRLAPRRDEHPSQPSFQHWQLGKGPLREQYKALASGVEMLVSRGGQEVFDKHDGVWRPVEYGDIAVLARTNTHVQQIAAALREGGIPVATVQPGLLQTPEAVLVLAGLRRVIDPSDTVSTAEIYSLLTCKEPEEWIAERLDYLRSGSPSDQWLESGEWSHPVLEELAFLRSRTPLLSPAEVLQAVIHVMAAPVHILSWCKDPDEARIRMLNLDSLLPLAHQYEQECLAGQQAPTLHGLLAWLYRCYSDGLDLFPEPPVNAVRVLTFHKSKGLEWPVVVLCDLDQAGKTDHCVPTVTSLTGVDASDPLRDRFIRFWPCPFGRNKGFIPVRDVLESTPLQEAAAYARQESLRLFYVAVTRARDCLVLATHSRSGEMAWLEEVGASCLVDGDEGGIHLPDGSFLPCSRMDCTLLSEHDTFSRERSRPLHWFALSSSPTQRLPEQVSPSLQRSSTPAVVDDEVLYGSSLEMKTEGSASRLGSALHDILAFGLIQRPVYFRPQAVERMLNAHGVAGMVAAEDLVRQVQAFRSYCMDRWNGADILVEVPIQQRLSTGQVLGGQIDMLLDTPSGWIIVDHKTGPAAYREREFRVREYIGQLQAYAGALEQLTGRPSKECLINFLAAGVIATVSMKRD